MFFGNSGLQSLGVSAKNPPDMSINDHRPTVNDYEMYREKHLWFVDLATTPLTYEIWFLANKFNYQSLWLKLYPAPGSGGGGGGGQKAGAAAGNGGHGGFPGGGGGGGGGSLNGTNSGAGGGGGGGSLNGTNSGAGGDGGDGMVIVIEYF